ncbi:TIGR02680 family protein [Rhodococcus sp. Z13]|uniref:TIGR02680 family protein n=1 Tax=Rhodococcus sacchari TaxID=2962047 RepID=A0ACD4DJY2_9NOCA|nr:TIGR02680 family protein [Rhodococcus sp. Z13]UYP20281.1 TIGR02680 family protein [Rhodococcus sp. Z13]
MTHFAVPSSDGPRVLPFPDRRRLSRAGILNVWHFADVEFVASGGRLVLRGPTGVGRTRALEMLLPFLLDGDRTRLDASGAGRVDLDELMRTGATGQDERVGFLWLELSGTADTLTIVARLRYSATTDRSEVHFFTTNLRVGVDLHLVDEHRVPLSRDELTRLVGPDDVTRDPERHRARVAERVFGLRGEAGLERYSVLLHLLHLLRSPDTGDRPGTDDLARSLTDALPPLPEDVFAAAAGQLDLLDETRREQIRLETEHDRLQLFHEVLRRYATEALRTDAEAARAAAQRVSETRREGAAAEAEEADLRTQVAAAEVRWQERRDQIDELDHALRGLTSHGSFRTAEDLAQSRATVGALARTADLTADAAEHARHQEHTEAEHAAVLLDELTAAVTRAAQRLGTARSALAPVGLPGDPVPGPLYLGIDRVAPALGSVRTGRETAPEPVVRPTVPLVHLVPDEIDPVREAVERAGAEVRRRREQADRRLVEARRLEAAEYAVREAQSIADRAGREAERLTAEVAEAETRVGAAASALLHRWREWIIADRTLALLPAVGRERVGLLHDLSERLDALLEDPEDAGKVLDEVDDLPREPARAAIAECEEAAAAGETRDRLDRAAREALEHEEAALRQESEGPRPAAWHPRTDGVPFWQAVDFAGTLGDDDRTGIESALLAAGFLTAMIDSEGRLRAQGGQVLVSPRGEPPAQPLSTVLLPDPDAGLPAAAITAVLNTIGFEDPAAVASVSRDGRWHNGVLRGRHTAETARYIGRAARDVATAARRVRLDEIRADLTRLDLAERKRLVDTPDPARRRREIDDHLATAPDSGALRAALDRRRQVTAGVHTAVTTAVGLRDRATALRAQWSTELETHRALCRHAGVPADLADLEALVEACRAAETACSELARDLAEVDAARTRFAAAVERFDLSTSVRVDAEELADSCRREWHAAAAAAAARAAAADLDVAELERELRRSEEERARADEQCRRTVAHREGLGRAVAEVRQRCAAARARLKRDRADLLAAGERLAWRLCEFRAALADGPGSVPLPDALTRPDDPEHVRAVAQELLDALPPASETDEDALLDAVRRFDRDTAGRFTVEHTAEDGTHRVRIAENGDVRTPAALLTTLARRVEEHRRQMAQREREVLTTVMLGGTVDEVRRCLDRARRLVDEVDECLTATRTTHGIGVRLGWVPAHADPDAEQLAHLFAEPTTAEVAEELAEVLGRRIERSYAADPAAGWVQHLARALDPRRWHDVEVTLTGPETGRERRISPRARISRGELRFVSYATMLAAVDLCLSGLPESDRAWRPVVLDDVFAGMDEPTAGTLVELLTRRDLDVLATGHSSWRCVSHEAELDVYEIHRDEDGAAVATLVREHGHGRHARPLVGPHM